MSWEEGMKVNILSRFRKIKLDDFSIKYENSIKQECIPVGCVPSVAVSVGGGGVCRGGSAWEGCLPQCMLGYTPPCEQNDRRL